MSDQITTAMVQGYRSNIELQFQQRGSRLASTVENETQHSEYEFYDRVGPTQAQELLTRHADTPQVNTPHSRRRIALRDFAWADLIDKKDVMRMLADPTSAYVMNAVSSLGREKDRSIITAALGTAYTGKTGSTTASFAAANIVAVDFVESGSAANSNLTIGKLRAARYILTKSESIDEQMDEQITCACTASQIRSLLTTTQITSADYNAVKALVDGKVDTFMGFKFVRLELLPFSSGVIRQVLIYPKSAIKLAVGAEITARVDERADKNYSTQVYVKASFGATRMWEEKVVSVLCDEAVV